MVKTSKGCIIDTLEGKIQVNDKDWVVRGPLGNFYVVKDEEFQEYYERIDNE